MPAVVYSTAYGSISIMKTSLLIWTAISAVLGSGAYSIAITPETEPEVTQLGWNWAEDNTTIASQENGVIEELATIKLDINSSCFKEIDNLLDKLPSVDSELSYETVYVNGTRTLTVVRNVQAYGENLDKRSVMEKKRKDEEHEFEEEEEEKEKGNKLESRGFKSWYQRKRMQLAKLQANRIFGKDDRIAISPTVAQRTPYSSTGQVSCGRFCRWTCTGTLVGPKHVLTAAHCIYSESPRRLKVGFLQMNGAVNWYSVVSFYIPGGWRKRKSVEYDYALIRLKNPPGRASLKMRSLSRRTKISFSAIDSSFTMRKSTCRPLTSSDSVIVTKCDAVKGNSGAGLLVKSAKHGHVVIGVLSASRARIHQELGTRYYNVASKLSWKKIMQISRWIKKA